MRKNTPAYKSLKRTLPFPFRISTRNRAPLTVDRAGPLSIVLPGAHKTESASPRIDTVPVELATPELALVALSTGKLKNPLAMVFSLVKRPFIFIAV